MATTEDLLKKFQKRDLSPARPRAAAAEPPAPVAPAAEDAPAPPPTPAAEFRRLRRRGSADEGEAATLEGLFDDRDGLIGLGG